MMNFKFLITAISSSALLFFSSVLTAEESSSPLSDQPKATKIKLLMDTLAKEKLEDDDIVNALTEAGLLSELDKKFTVWAQYRRNRLDDDRNGNGKEADGDTYAAGVNYMMSPRLTIGVGAIVNKTDLESDVSAPPISGYSEVDNSGKGLMFSGAYMLDSGLVLDAAFSYQNIDIDITDYSALAPASDKSTDGMDYMVSLGASIGYFPLADNLWLNSRASFTHAWGKQDSYADQFGRRHDSQDYKTGTAALDTNLNYQVNRYLRPYIGILLGYDLYSDTGSPALVQNPGGFGTATSVPYQDERKRFSHGFRLGLATDITPDMNVAAEYQETHWGSDLEVSSVGVNLNYRF